MTGKTAAIVVAAGRGTRMGTQESKQYLPLGGKPILIHTLELFDDSPEVDGIVVVTGSADVERCRSLAEQHGIRKPLRVVEGGAERQHSVEAGLRALDAETEWVLVHDAVRPFATRELIRDCLEAARQIGAAVPAVPAKDTVKVAGDDGIIVSTPDRRSLWMVQTPQAFRVSALRGAHEQARANGWSATDDAMLIELAGGRVKIVPSDYRNIKITTPDDLEWAAYMMGHIMGKREGNHA